MWRNWDRSEILSVENIDTTWRNVELDTEREEKFPSLTAQGGPGRQLHSQLAVCDSDSLQATSVRRLNYQGYLTIIKSSSMGLNAQI